jgi:hypothetical protein
MFGLLPSSRRDRIALSARPALETLEDRFCLTGPTLTGLEWFWGTGPNVNIQGNVQDPHPQTAVVRILGTVNEVDLTPDAQGNFAVTAPVPTPNTILQITATDDQNLTDQAFMTLHDIVPQITAFSGAQIPGGYYQFTGRVAGGAPVLGLLVVFGGAPIDLNGANTKVNADGSFTLTVKMNGQPTDDGLATAVVADYWGAQSNTAYWNVYQSGGYASALSH